MQALHVLVLLNDTLGGGRENFYWIKSETFINAASSTDFDAWKESQKYWNVRHIQKIFLLDFHYNYPAFFPQSPVVLPDMEPFHLKQMVAVPEISLQLNLKPGAVLAAPVGAFCCEREHIPSKWGVSWVVESNKAILK